MRPSKSYVMLPKKPYHYCQTRTRELDNLTLRFDRMQSIAGDECVVTTFLTGPPGSGKTQLAGQFGERISKRESNTNCPPPLVFTLNADSAKSLVLSAKDVIDLLSLTKKAVREGDEEINVVRLYLEEIRRFLQKYRGEWLLIFDNVFHHNEITTILPQPGNRDWGRGKVLVTSQDNNLVQAGNPYADVCCLHKGMEKEDAKALLEEVGGANACDSEMIDQVAKELDYAPLSLACAATCVRQMSLDRPSINPWEQFLAVYREKKGQLQYTTFGRNNDVYPHSMAFVVKLAVEQMENSSEVLRLTFEFLSYCSLNPVPLVAVNHYVRANLEQCDNADDQEIKGEISRCSLLIHDCKSCLDCSPIETIAFHQVVSHAFELSRTERDANLSEEEKKRKFGGVVSSMNASLTLNVIRPDSPESVVFQILLSVHLESLIAYAKSKNWMKSEEFVMMSVNVVRCLYHVPGGTDAQRMKYLKTALQVADEIQITAINYCYLLESLGFYHREMHQLGESEKVLKQALAMTEEHLDNREWLALKASILKTLSWTYKLLRKLDQAIEKMELSINVNNVIREVYGSNCDEIVESLCELAIVYRDLKEMVKAKERVDEARRLAEERRPNRDLKMAKAFCVSGKIYLHCSYGEEEHVKKNELLEKSREFHEEALEIYEGFYGKDHLDNAGVLITYAAVCKELGKSDRAMVLVKRAVKVYQAIQHEIGLCFARSQEADILLASGRVEEDTRLLSVSLGAKFLLASLFRDKKKFFEAREMFDEVLIAIKQPGKSLPSRRWAEQAKEFESECNVELSRNRWSSLMSVSPVTLLIAMLVGLACIFIPLT